MLKSRTSRVALLSVVGALAAATSTAPAASAASQRYASPTGSGDCSSASPCKITQAVSGAKAGDEVIVTPGDYTVTSSLVAPAQITIHGVAGNPRPRLMFSGQGQSGLSLGFGSTVQYVEIDQAAQAAALWAMDASTVDQVIVKGPGGGFAWSELVAINNSTIRNSIVVASGSNARAIVTATAGGTLTSKFRNVTAIATGSGGVAVEAHAVVGGKATVEATNVIARGGPPLNFSFEAITDSSVGAQATILASHSNYTNQMTVGSNATITSGGGNQSNLPAFVNAATGDYRQAAGSPTIGAGLNDPTNGPFDVEGDPRSVGTTDIGADEFVLAPAATTGPADMVTDHSATLSGSVNANGAPTRYHFEYGPTTAYDRTTATADAGSGGAVAAAATLEGLSPATTYHYRLVATNSGWVTKGDDQTFTTASPPPPSPTASTPTASTPTPTRAFAGVRLVSTRLTFGGRFVTLKLSCPAATAGHCSGRTKLTARRGAGASAATTITLGRAPFSIAAGNRAKARVRVTRAGRQLLGRVRRLRGKDTNVARDGARRSATTVAAVTIRRRQR